MNGSLGFIPGGDAGTYATLSVMRQLAVNGAISPVVRRVTAALAADAGGDVWLQARLIRDWIDTHTQFLADPSVAEALQLPADMVRTIEAQGFAQGDCDDVAILAAAMALTIGLRARFVVVAFGAGGSTGTAPAPFAHVWTELGDVQGRFWLAVDPTRPAIGMPVVTRKVTQEV